MVFLGSSASAIDSWVRHWEPRHDWSTWRKNASTNVKVFTHVGAIIQHNPVKWMLNGNVFVAPKQSFPNSCQNVHFEIWSYHDIGPSDRPSAQGGRDWCFSGNNLWAKTVKIAIERTDEQQPFWWCFAARWPTCGEEKVKIVNILSLKSWHSATTSIQTHTKSEMKQRLLLAFLSKSLHFSLANQKNDPNSKGWMPGDAESLNEQSIHLRWNHKWHPKHQLNHQL